MKKIPSFLLVMILASNLLAGCGESEPVSNPTKSSKTLPNDLKISVINVDRKARNNPRIELEIDRRLTLEELKTTAKIVHANSGGQNQESLIFFYLPTQNVGVEMAWARVRAPNGEATILGLSPEEEKNLKALPRPSGILVGSWLDDVVRMRQTIVKRGSKLVLLREFESGTNERELNEIKPQAGEKSRLKYRDKNYSQNGEFLVILTTGELIEYDNDGKIFTAESIQIY
jgi:hypothetical protein